MASVPVQARNNFIPDLDIKMEAALADGPPLRVNGQKFALITYLAPHGTRQRNIEAGMMILGVFSDERLAKAHIEKLARAGYIYFDIFIVQMYCFFPLPPPLDMENAEYINAEMNELMGAHRRAVCSDQDEVQRRVNEAREHSEQKSEAAPTNIPTNGDGDAVQPRKCTDEERKMVRCELGTPIFIRPEDVPKDAPLVDLSEHKF